jgi:hypothetical protein
MADESESEHEDQDPVPLTQSRDYEDDTYAQLEANGNRVSFAFMCELMESIGKAKDYDQKYKAIWGGGGAGVSPLLQQIGVSREGREGELTQYCRSPLVVHTKWLGAAQWRRTICHKASMCITPNHDMRTRLANIGSTLRDVLRAVLLLMMLSCEDCYIDEVMIRPPLQRPNP